LIIKETEFPKIYVLNMRRVFVGKNKLVLVGE